MISNGLEQPPTMPPILDWFRSEHSGGNTQIRTSITKAGNTHIRVLVEAAQCYTRGSVGKVSRFTKTTRRKGARCYCVCGSCEQVTRRKFYRMKRQSKKHNVAVTAIAESWRFRLGDDDRTPRTGTNSHKIKNRSQTAETAKVKRDPATPCLEGGSEVLMDRQVQ